ncbi:uncharacterized protein BJ171DRAFT_471990 [Polychytrium aggregatum]|uniref:uncharacterized protein n=1 Tax=Polychytrium aggregatum TaxID=110093 RepID=UPI0022FE3989|nr:uncharacterized protein BJ171DRAFT_471990 [Polychytrium aggregatum]KAI9208327.1 hypothetical protein BJ171DRAFT_471990 [Polychytrium aggregatum]
MADFACTWLPHTRACHVRIEPPSSQPPPQANKADLRHRRPLPVIELCPSPTAAHRRPLRPARRKAHTARVLQRISPASRPPLVVALSLSSSLPSFLSDRFGTSTPPALPTIPNQPSGCCSLLPAVVSSMEDPRPSDSSRLLPTTLLRPSFLSSSFDSLPLPSFVRTRAASLTRRLLSSKPDPHTVDSEAAPIPPQTPLHSPSPSTPQPSASALDFASDPQPCSLPSATEKQHRPARFVRSPEAPTGSAIQIQRPLSEPSAAEDRPGPRRSHIDVPRALAPPPRSRLSTSLRSEVLPVATGKPSLVSSAWDSSLASLAHPAVTRDPGFSPLPGVRPFPPRSNSSSPVHPIRKLTSTRYPPTTPELALSALAALLCLSCLYYILRALLLNLVLPFFGPRWAMAFILVSTTSTGFVLRANYQSLSAKMLSLVRSVPTEETLAFVSAVLITVALIKFTPMFFMVLHRLAKRAPKLADIFIFCSIVAWFFGFVLVGIAAMFVFSWDLTTAVHSSLVNLFRWIWGPSLGSHSPGPSPAHSQTPTQGVTDPLFLPLPARRPLSSGVFIERPTAHLSPEIVSSLPKRALHDQAVIRNVGTSASDETIARSVFRLRPPSGTCFRQSRRASLSSSESDLPPPGVPTTHQSLLSSMDHTRRSRASSGAGGADRPNSNTSHPANLAGEASPFKDNRHSSSESVTSNDTLSIRSECAAPAAESGPVSAWISAVQRESETSTGFWEPRNCQWSAADGPPKRKAPAYRPRDLQQPGASSDPRIRFSRPASK